MRIRKDLIPLGEGIHTRYKRSKTLGLVIHWIGTECGNAATIRKNFQYSKLGTQYVCDWYTGEIIQCTPEDAVTYHVGSSYGYTQLKETLVGEENPNWYFVGVECCIDPTEKIMPGWDSFTRYRDLGRPSTVQYQALVEFAADFLTRNHLTVSALYRHYDITGKMCHVWFVKDQARWEKFKDDVAAKMKEGNEMTHKEIEALVKEMVRDAMPAVYTTLEEVPDWARPIVSQAIDKGMVHGITEVSAKDGGPFRLTEDNLVTLQLLANIL